MKNLLLIALLAVTARAETVSPAPLDKARYSETLAKSPFVLETKVTAEPVVEKVNPFKDLYLRGIGKADGKDYVVIGRVGEERAMRFLGEEPGEDSLTVKSVKLGTSFHDTKVMLQKGTETGEVGFSEQAITAVPQAIQVRPPNVPQQFNPQPGQPPRPPGAAPIVRNAAPAGNPMIPRPQFTAPIQMPKPQGTNGVVPTFKQGTGFRSTDPNRRQRTNIINN